MTRTRAKLLAERVADLRRAIVDLRASADIAERRGKERVRTSEFPGGAYAYAFGALEQMNKHIAITLESIVSALAEEIGVRS